VEEEIRPVSDSQSAQRNQRNPEAPLAAAETLRLAAAPPSDDKPAKGEDRIPLLWRVFGGTVLSILALVGVTVYQQFSSAIADLRSSVVRLNETHADMLRKDEYSTRMTSVWNAVKGLQESQSTVTALKERSGVRDVQMKDFEDRRETMLKELQAVQAMVALLKEREMVRDQQIKTDSETLRTVHKEMQTLGGVVTGLKERTLLQEQQAKYDEERKELLREVQALRERIACVEGRNGATPPKPKPMPPAGN
jgi:hypothetical protein